MEEWFTHQVEIEEPNLALQPVCKELKTGLVHPLRHTSATRTERATKVAAIGNLEVAALDHR